MAFDTLYPVSHDVRTRFFLSEGFSSDELDLSFMTVGALGCRLVMTPQALHSRFVDLPVFLSGGMANVTIQYSCDMFSMGKRKVVNLNRCIFKSLVTLAALRMGDFIRLGQRESLLRMACRAGGLLPTVTLKARFFRRPKSRRVMGIMIDIVVTGGARVLQLLNMETVRNGDTVRIDFGRSSLDIKNTLMTTDTVRIDLVKFGRKTGMFPLTLERKNIDAWDQGMAGCVALRAVDLGMHG